MRGCTGDCVQWRQECPTPTACCTSAPAESATDIGAEPENFDAAAGVIVLPLVIAAAGVALAALLALLL